MSVNKINQRKKDHLKIAVSDDSQTGDAGFGRYRFLHNALPEINFDKINTSTKFLSKKVNYPLFISCMTGGVDEGERLNKNLAIAAEEKGIAFGVGSQRVAIEHPRLKSLFNVRKYAPNVPVIANVGLVQLNYGFGLSEVQRIVDMVEADALAFHLNPIQEVIQPEGDRNFRDLLPKLEKIIKKLKVPVITKEVGFGLSDSVVKRLYKIGVRIFDTAGWGGTSWAAIEGKRRSGFDELGQLFGEWGIPTTESIKMCVNFKSKLKAKDQKEITIIGSGGVRSGIDIAKCISLGSDMVGIAQPFAVSGLKSEKEVIKLIDELSYELKVAMFGVGSSNLRELRKIRLREQN